MLTGFVELIALEVPLVEVEMAAVLQPHVGATGQHERQVGVAVAVSVRHAAAEEGHRRAQERLAAQIFCLRQPGEEVAVLLDGEGVIVRELLHVALIAAVVAELMARLGDADLGNGNGISLATQAEGGHASQIGLEGEHDQIIDGAEIVARQRVSNVAVGALAVGRRDGGERRVEPGVGPPRPDLCLTDGGEVLFHAPFVGRSHLLFELAHFGEVGVQDTPFAA